MFQKILVAYDSSPSSETALSQGGELARLCQGELHLFGVIVSTGGMAIGQAAGAEDMLGQEGNAIRSSLEDSAGKLRAEGLRVVTQTAEGSPAEEIARYALQTGADLLIIGHIPHFSLGHWLQGSVAKALLRELPCSILVAKEC
ncbi:universal stress protein [Acidithiobacillus sp.]|uniref:universal stress protein n=1 Tax=Acidithiobacillus sp. TaxID=1872118 RepID=UPI0025C08456|nr:universal stress protein [Acidithiobacillus sp.]